VKVITVFTLIAFLTFSLVTVPRAEASVMQGTLGRLAFRAASPAFWSAVASGSSVVLAVGFGIGVDYVVFKSGAITALKNWWAAGPGGYAYSLQGSNVLNWYNSSGVPTGSQQTGGFSVAFRNSSADPSTNPSGWYANYYNSSGQYITYYGPNTYAYLYNFLFGHAPGSYDMATYQDTMDYGTQLASSQPSFPANTVYASPGAVNRLAGGAQVTKTATMSDADADKFISGLGGTAIDTAAGTQAGALPTSNDNTVTAGDSASIGLLDRIAAFVSNLVGINTATEAMRQTLDNSLVVQQQMSAKLDNASAFPPAAQTALDNIAAGTQTVAGKMDNVAQGIQSLSESQATVQTLSSRLAAVRDLAASRFPFSIGAALVVTPPAGGNYDLGTLHLPGMEIPIRPFESVLGTTFQWMRTLIQALFWASTLFMIVRRVASL